MSTKWLILMLLLMIPISTATVIFDAPMTGNIQDTSILARPTKMYIIGTYGYDFQAKQNSIDIFNLTNLVNHNVSYNSQGAQFNGINSVFDNADLNSWLTGRNNFSVILTANFSGSPLHENLFGWWNAKNNRITFAAGDVTVAFSTASGAGTTVSGLNDSKFHTVGASFNTTHLLVYFDGKYNYSQALSGLLNTSTDAFYVGAAGGIAGGPTGGYYFNNTIREVYMYDHYLGSQEMSDFTTQGSFGTNRAGFAGSSLTLTGLEYVAVNYTKDPIGNKSFSIVFWAKKLRNSTITPFVTKGELPGNNKMLITALWNTNKPKFAFYNDDLDGNSTINDYNWHYYSFVYDAATNQRRIYVDAVIDGYDVASADFLGNGDDFMIGRYAINDEIFNGSISNLKIYNTTISSEDIITLYYEGIDQFNVSWSSYATDTNNLNYSRNLSYTINYYCNEAHNMIRYINDTYSKTYTLNCDNTSKVIADTYQASTEGPFKIQLYMNLTGTGFNYTKEQIFISDLYNPTIKNISMNASEGWYNTTTPQLSIRMQCNDTIYPNITYIMNLNGNVIFNDNRTNLYMQENTTVLSRSSNQLTAVCSDPFSGNTEVLTKNIWYKPIFLIDEKTNTIFDISNITSVKLYYDDNSSVFDFKANNKANITFVSNNQQKLRLELGYPSGDIITRYIDVSLSNGTMRLCANKDNVLHYEQLIISATIRPISLKSVYSDCIIDEDYVRFVYQDAYVLKAYTTNNLYYMYTVDGVNKVYLASMDGSVSTYYNIDVLQFKGDSTDLGILGSSLAIGKSAGTTIEIFYENQKNDSVRTDVIIERMNNSAVVLNTQITETPNTFYLYYDYSTLNISANEEFKFTVTSYDINNEPTTTIRYFNTDGSVGTLSSPIAFVIALLLTAFGLTFVVSRITFGWFGIFIIATSIFFLSFAVLTWYILLLYAINFIILIYILITVTTSNIGGVLS